MKSHLHNRFIYCLILTLSMVSGYAFADNTWLSLNGILTDNVKLNGAAVDNNTYKADPPFVTTNVPPNVLIVLDNSGSMNDWAYSSSYDPTRYVPGDPVKKGYYGYFEPGKTYKYNGTAWEQTTETTGTIANPIASGDFLNWATMRRIDVARKLLIGGKATPRSPNPGSTVALYGETAPSPSWDFAKTDSGGRMSPFPAASYSYEMRGDSLYVIPNYTVIDPAPKVPKSNANTAWYPYPSNSALYRTVDDKTINDDVDYIYLTSGTAAQLFGYTAFSSSDISGTIQSINVRFRAKKTSNGTNRIKGVIEVGGTEYQSSIYSNLYTSWRTYQFTWTANPKRYDECVAAGASDLQACAAWQADDLTNSASAYYLSAFGVYNVTNASSSLYPMVTWIELTVSLSAPSGGPYKIKVNWKGEEWAYQQGIIPNLGDEARFGLAFYNMGKGQESGYSNGRYDGGYVANYVDFGQPVNMITTIHNMTPNTWTPLAETLFEITRYFRQDQPYYTGNSPADFKVGSSYDPFYYQYSKVSGSNLPDQYVSCAKSYILMITDGEPTQDKNIPTTESGVPSGKNLQDYDEDGKDPGSYPSNGSDYLDDIALWARTVDARPDLDGDQNIYLYTVFAFGKGSQLLKDASINGGFDDLNGDGRPGPDLKEYLRDSDGDGSITSADLPMTYFEGDDGYELEASIINAITAILKRASSGTSVSVLGSSWKGQGSIYQAYFYPERTETLRRIKWTGYFRSLFVDMNGLIHEDTDGDKQLILENDKVAKIVFDGTSKDTMVEYYWDKDGDGKYDTDRPTPNKVSINETIPVWDGGILLAARDPSTRTIYTTVDNAGLIDFSSANAAILRPYIRAADNTVADKIIRFIRGEQITGWRDRQITVPGASSIWGSTCTNDLCTWKLGDIVFSDPVVVPAPSESYDQYYMSGDYASFKKAYSKRRTVIYTGANDGMLHAFNGGYSCTDTSGAPPAPNMPQIAFGEKPDCTNDPDGTPGKKPLGMELWAFIPYDLLPHLAWLVDPDYQHVFYVDQTVRVTDAKIFTPDSDHVEGWGTILIVGLRFGGGGIDVTDIFGGTSQTKSFKSAYYALDITNPEVPPTLLWRFTDSDLGFTLSWPDILRIDTDDSMHNGNEKWYAIFGSGPTNYRGGRVASAANDTTNVKFSGVNSTNPLIYIIDLKTGQATGTAHPSSGRVGVIKLSETNAFTGSPSTMDFGREDFNTDTAYLGVNYCASGCDASGYGTFYGNLYRISMKKDTNPGNWSVSKAFSAYRPITSRASQFRVNADSWVYFGTGRFIHIDDRFTTTQDAFYGIKDPCWDGSCSTEIQKSSLLNSTDIVVLTNGQLEQPVSYAGYTANSFEELKNIMLKSNAAGWYKNLTTTGERVFVNGLVALNLVSFGSFIPSTDICSFEGYATQYFLSALTGTAYYLPDSSVIYTTPLGHTAISDHSDKSRGVPSPPAFHVDAHGNVTLFVQSSTGAIIRINIDNPVPTTGIPMTWMEKTM